ncbi:MAG: GNAT family N-acetyltransferase [Acidiferrobacter sp.]
MTENVTIRRALSIDAPEVAVMVGELLNEITATIGIQAFHFHLDETIARLKGYIDQEKYFVFMAESVGAAPVGFVALYECHALYAEGAFGTIPELFVRPGSRSHNVGLRLLNEAKTFARSRGWKRLEVTTPPLPQFEKTMAFYEREGFAIAGGRKLKASL